MVPQTESTVVLFNPILCFNNYISFNDYLRDIPCHVTIQSKYDIESSALLIRLNCNGILVF